MKIHGQVNEKRKPLYYLVIYVPAPPIRKSTSEIERWGGPSDVALDVTLPWRSGVIVQMLPACETIRY